jgi:hypothetical protein
LKREKKAPSKRAAVRLADRDAQKTRTTLARLEKARLGGSAGRPIEVASAAVVEVDATREPCPACGGALTIAEHRAEGSESSRVRVAALLCKVCRFAFEKFYRIVDRTSLN